MEENRKNNLSKAMKNLTYSERFLLKSASENGVDVGFNKRSTFVADVKMSSNKKAILATFPPRLARFVVREGFDDIMSVVREIL